MSEFLPINRVAERYATTRHSIYRWMRDDRDFPAPIRLPGDTLRWRLADLEAWEATRIVDSDSRLPAIDVLNDQPHAVGDTSPMRHVYRQHGLRTFYPFDDMEIGDSFDIPVDLRERCQTAVSKRKKRKGEVFTLRKISGEVVRVTRVEEPQPMQNTFSIRINPAHADWFEVEFSKSGLTFTRVDLKSVAKFQFVTLKDNDKLSLCDLFMSLDRKRKNERLHPEQIACSPPCYLPKLFPIDEPDVLYDYEGLSPKSETA